MGSGTFYYKNGDKYEGEYKDGKRFGIGKYYWASGITYDG